MNTLRGMACVAVFAACGGAQAQNAIGDGTALDRNLQTGTIGVNRPVRDLSAEIRLRNAVVTGNAPNGMSFRGGVGYISAGEFMGFLGTNTLFRFRRDSINSGLAGLGIRGTDALQYQFALTTGNTPPPGMGLTGPGYVLRSGAGATGDNVAAREAGTASNLPVRQVRPDDRNADPRGQELWTLRSPSAYVATRGLSPSLVAVVPGAQGRSIGLMASPLTGLSPTFLDPYPAAEPEKPPARPEPPPGSATPLDLGQNMGTSLKAGETEPAVNRDLTAGARSGYDELIKRYSQALPDPETDPAKLPLWQQRVNEVRRQLEQAEKRRAAAEPEKPAEGEEEPAGPGGFRPETLRMLRQPGPVITRLSPEGVDAYAAHMRKGEEFLGQGQYFFAEERFRAALSARPDDPMAAIGRVHAQLGASLFASAAMNLRMLLVSHPELAGARYGPEILPDRARIKRIMDRLQSMIDTGNTVGRDTGLLLAYLGYQTGDRAAIERGLSIMEGTGKDQVPDAQLQKLAALQREVWTAAADPGK